jgi:hypothetical protein
MDRYAEKKIDEFVLIFNEWEMQNNQIEMQKLFNLIIELMRIINNY